MTARPSVSHIASPPRTIPTASTPQSPQSLPQSILLHLGRPHLDRRRLLCLHLLTQLHTRLIRHLIHQAIHILLRRPHGCGARRRILVVSRRDIQVLKLRLKPIHDGADLLKVHGFHGRVHALDDVGHGAGDLAHGDGGLDARGDGVNAGAEAEEVEFLVLFADGILGVDFGNVRVVLLDCLTGDQ